MFSKNVLKPEGMPFALSSAVFALATSGQSQTAIVTDLSDLRTKAEQTNYKETSSYVEVINFINRLQAAGAPIQLRYIGKSVEGRAIPLVIASRPMVYSVADAKASGKPIVYLQANIHAGEVEGKEATLALLRDWSAQTDSPLDKAIFLVNPIYNADGNDKFGPGTRNRPGQTGPDIVGTRANGQGFDLNRDCVKAESFEMRAALAEVYSWRPDVVIDLHTTNGTRHGYPLTFSGPLHPNTHPTLAKFALNEFLPAVRRRMSSRYKTPIFDYGNGTLKDGKWVWSTFASEPRYVTNYGGLRGALTILSEAMVYEPFDIRVRVTRDFVQSCTDEILRNAKRIVENHRKIESEVVAWGLNPSRAPALSTSSKIKLRGTEKVLMEKQAGTARRTGPVREIETISMPVFDRFEGEKFGELAFAYTFPADNSEAAMLLARHGVQVEQLEIARVVDGEEFDITAVKQASSLFQGHRLINMDGSWKAKRRQLPRGTYIVRSGQPLGLLIFDLMDPLCSDGLTAWGFFGESFAPSAPHPVYRLRKPEPWLRVSA